MSKIVETDLGLIIAVGRPLTPAEVKAHKVERNGDEVAVYLAPEDVFDIALKLLESLRGHRRKERKGRPE